MADDAKKTRAREAIRAALKAHFDMSELQADALIAVAEFGDLDVAFGAKREADFEKAVDLMVERRGEFTDINELISEVGFEQLDVGVWFLWNGDVHPDDWWDWAHQGAAEAFRAALAKRGVK